MGTILTKNWHKGKYLTKRNKEVDNIFAITNVAQNYISNDFSSHFNKNKKKIKNKLQRFVAKLYP